MRINVFLARAGVGVSRRKADDLVSSGRVVINGKVIKDFSFDVKSQDTVKVDGTVVSVKEYKYIVFNKPEGVITTKGDKYAAQIVMDFLPKSHADVFPIGRLDKDTTGLLILTNDGNFANKIMHPRYGIEKEYKVIVKGAVPREFSRKAVRGVMDNGELLKVKSMKIGYVDNGETGCYVIVTEGKKRHVRRIFRQLGFARIILTRIRIGKLYLDDRLKPGKFKVLKHLKI